MVSPDTSRYCCLSAEMQTMHQNRLKLKTHYPKNKYTELPPLSEPNEEIQMNFAGPLTNNNKDTYILVTVDRYSRYPHAEIYNNCDTDTAINYLKDYIKFHGIPRSKKCDQAQAFKAEKFWNFLQGKQHKINTSTNGRPKRHRNGRKVDTNNKKKISSNNCR